MKKINFTPTNKLASLVALYPVPSKTITPEWYKKIPQYSGLSKKIKVRNGGSNSTVKNCAPFLDAMIAGYMAVLQDDIIVDWENGYPQLNWRTERKNITYHDLAQSSGISVPTGYYPQVIKFENDIAISLPKGYSLFCTHPSNRFDLPFQTISGFVDSDRYENDIKFPFFIKNEWEGIIEKGTPVAQLIPIKRENWSSKINEFDQDLSTKNINNFMSKIVKSYKNNVWIKKIYE